MTLTRQMTFWVLTLLVGILALWVLSGILLPFVAGMAHERSKLEIVRAILLLAHNLKVDVVAEGVETVEQLAQLRALDCEYAQGYLFAPPLDAEAADKLLSENRKW